MKDKEISELLEQIFRQAQMQFGSAVKSRWLYDGDGCPGCSSQISTMKWKKKNALSLNAFIYRDHGVLIAYLLCGKCAHFIFKESEKDPITPTPLHAQIEKTLKKAYLRHMGH
jgi:hypothetical protein